ncbi:MAG TPA: DUF885 family protein, partial [Phenylobacterium sp.]|nr:DUF885 family protein [Phenylobacterium sp.]
MPNRRQLLVGAAALAATPAFGAVSPDAVLSALLARHMDEYLTLSPQAAADLLTDARGRAARHRLDDRSLEGKARDLAAARRWRKELAGVNRAALSPAGQVEYDTAAFAYEMLDEVGARYGFQDHALRPGPYLISQMSGDYYWLPEDYARAPMAEREDAQAYLDRFAAFATALDQETERVRGLLADMPLAGIFLMFGSFALLGFAPFGSFLGEISMLGGLLEHGHVRVVVASRKVQA